MGNKGFCQSVPNIYVNCKLLERLDTHHINGIKPHGHFTDMAFKVVPLFLQWIFNLAREYIEVAASFTR